jgi:hypothetical protein
MLALWSRHRKRDLDARSAVIVRVKCASLPSTVLPRPQGKQTTWNASLPSTQLDAGFHNQHPVRCRPLPGGFLCTVIVYAQKGFTAPLNSPVFLPRQMLWRIPVKIDRAGACCVGSKGIGAGSLSLPMNDASLPMRRFLMSCVRKMTSVWV